MKDIFISYRRSDSSFLATKIRDRLEQTFPGHVFLDVSGIDGGVDFIEKLKVAISNARVVLVLIGHQWLVSNNKQTKLGQTGDFVTEEIRMALEAEIPIIPILVDGTQMPSFETLPVRLQGISRCNAVPITHIHFDSDVEYIVASIYDYLGINPPSKLERFLEALSLGQYKTNERSRDRMALYSALNSFFCIVLLFTIQDASPFADDPSFFLTVFGYGGLILFFNILSLNSSRRRGLAILGTIVSAIFLIGLLFHLSRGGILNSEIPSPWQPWREAQRLADINNDKLDIPSNQLYWQTYPPFNITMGPLPLVQCNCLKIIEKPQSASPYIKGSVVALRSNCTVEALFLVVRSKYRESERVNRWIPESGRQFVVIKLLENQVIRLPVGDTYGLEILPWRCH